MLELASEHIRTHWRDTLDRVFRGETIAVVRYGKQVAIMVQPEEYQRILRQCAKDLVEDSSDDPSA